MNSSVEVNFTAAAATGGSASPGTGGGGISGTGTAGGETPPTTTETVVSVTSSGMPTADDIADTLGEGGYSDEQIAAAKGIAASTSITQAVKVEKTSGGTGPTTYNTTVTAAIKNNSSKKWKDVKVVVGLAKSVASDASEVNSDFAMNVLKADPIIEFSIPEIQVGQSVDLIYNIATNISETTAKNIGLPIVASFIEAEPCEGVVCADKDCQTGSCNNATGQCQYTNKADGTACEANKECKAGACVDVVLGPGQPTPPTAPVAPADYTLLIVLAAAIILAAGGFYKWNASKGKA